MSKQETPNPGPFLKRLPGSFRDPSGFVFEKEGVLYRAIDRSYLDNYRLLFDSGLYDELVEAGLLIPHEEASPDDSSHLDCALVIKPYRISFVSYPYEWSFSQFKAAASATIQIQKRAMQRGMSLKDCSAFNVQFRDNEPVFIDTLSFEPLAEQTPWVAYGQFCRHFLAPLALMGYRDVRLNHLLRVHLDGCPLDLASSLLPTRTWFSLPLLLHVHLHARWGKSLSHKVETFRERRVRPNALHGLVDQLASGVEGIEWRPAASVWSDYYAETTYSEQAFDEKKRIVKDFLEQVKPGLVWDLGANTGLFSRMAGEMGIRAISFDMDPAAVEINYLECRRMGRTNVLPLLSDLANPSPGIGWDNSERMSLVERGPADTVMALALVHHLAIANNVPLRRVAEFLSRICRSLIVEFVPKNDPQVQRMLATRKDIFGDYSREAFEKEFSRCFTIKAVAQVGDGGRTVYLMGRREKLISSADDTERR